MRLGPDLKQYDELVRLAYEAPTEDPPWRSFLECFCRIIDARDASILIQQIPHGPQPPDRSSSNYMLVTSDTAPHLTPDFLDAVINANIAVDIPQPQPGTVTDILAENEFFSSRLYLDFLKPANIKHIAGIDIYRSDSLCIQLSTQRGNNQQAFSAHELGVLELLAPHLLRTLQFRAETGEGRQIMSLYEQILDKLDMGVALLDERGRIVSSNHAARQAMRPEHGLNVIGNRLVAAEAADIGRLRKAIADASSIISSPLQAQQGQCIGLRDRSGTIVTELVIKPCSETELGARDEHIAVAVYIHTNIREAHPINSEALTGLYGLTGKEAITATLVASGMGLSDVAAQMAVSVNTVKTHLRSVYDKTGLNRQAQLISLLGKSSVRLV